MGVRLQYEYPFTCPSCKIRTSQSTFDGKCINCGHVVNDVATRSQLSPVIYIAIAILGVFILYSVGKNVQMVW
jgi:hypothetical protein